MKRSEILTCFCSYLIRNKMNVWPARFVMLGLKFRYSIIFMIVISHYCCEIDDNCPFLVYLFQLVNNHDEMLYPTLKSKPDLEILRRNLNFIDEHFSSYLHFTNFQKQSPTRHNGKLKIHTNHD